MITIDYKQKFRGICKEVEFGDYGVLTISDSNHYICSKQCSQGHVCCFRCDKKRCVEMPNDMAHLKFLMVMVEYGKKD
jgi:hypothetical protein